MTSADEFSRHLARVRDRFAAALDGKIAESFAAIPAIAAGGDDACAIVVTAHRRLHEMCGIAPTLGFPETGKAARAAESVIRAAARARRALKAEEIVALEIELDALRAAARTELQAHATAGGAA
jgi:hypothetical protein